MFFKSIIKLIVAINANSKPAHISLGIAFGLLLALVPGSNLLWVLLLLTTFFIKLNMTVEFVSLALFKSVTPLLATPLNGLGYLIVGWPPLEGFFSFICNTPLLAFFRLNNTLVAGGLVSGIILFIPVFFLGNLVVGIYRRHIRDRIAQVKILKKIMAIPLIAKIAGAVREASALFAN
ncbi:MAG: TIGR03546 family protein [Spirochaetales bacterium]|nr:TIGR03546 family protein [Spirochaetales bacterium]